MNDPAIYRFGPFRLLVGRRELLLQDMPVALGQRAIEVLLTLVRNAGQLVTKDEIMAAVWPNVIVEENNLQVHISALRKILTSAGDQQTYLSTVSGRGYRFVAPVERGEASQMAVGPALASSHQPQAAAPPGNLTTALTRFIGRADELAHIESRLSSARLVTLTGPGGVGKTRLAVEAGWRAQPRYRDGVWVVELAALQDETVIGAAIAETLGLTSARDGSVAAVGVALQVQQLLIILDNCEHLVAAGASAAEQLLQTCPGVSILATSREPLSISGETVLRVASLALPPATETLTATQALTSDALALFGDRAAAAADGWKIDDANAPIVASICRRLDGIPLAIEMAAPRLRAMSLQQLASGLENRLRLLASESRTAQPRHRTLRAVIDWSYALLGDDEKKLLQRLAVFAGSASLDSVIAVAGVADPDAPELISLVDKSLVVVDRPTAQPRYRLAAATRDYALELLGAQRDRLRRTHAEHYRDRLAAAAAAWETTAGSRWLEQHGDDVDELRAALDWAFGPGGDVALGIELVANSHELWGEIGSLLEHRRWVDEALRHAADGTPRTVMAKLLSWHAGDVRELDDPADYTEAMRAASLHAAEGDAFGEGRALLRAGSGRMLEEGTQGETLLRRAHVLLRPFGETKALASCLSTLASVRLLAGSVRDAQQLHAEAVAISRRLAET